MSLCDSWRWQIQYPHLGLNIQTNASVYTWRWSGCARRRRVCVSSPSAMAYHRTIVTENCHEMPHQKCLQRKREKANRAGLRTTNSYNVVSPHTEGADGSFNITKWTTGSLGILIHLIYCDFNRLLVTFIGASSMDDMLTCFTFTLCLTSEEQPAYRRALALWLWPLCADRWSAVKQAYKCLYI